MSHRIIVRNVNHALPIAVMKFHDPDLYRTVAPRGMVTRELCGPVITTYQRPLERVLFEPKRDANPFFHLFESLWILAGRDDVGWLKFFLPRISDYSDGGVRFHGAYGERMANFSQVRNVVEELRQDPDSRRAVIALWQPERDSGYTGKDMPCNCTITFKIRDGALHMTVFNRSNDMVWGAYGANVVQFSMIQEYIASLVGVPVGQYHQISDSFHVYEEQDAWEALADIPLYPVDPYEEGLVRPYPLVVTATRFDRDLHTAVETIAIAQGENVGGILFDSMHNPFFGDVVAPMYNALIEYRRGEYQRARWWLGQCCASDWRAAGEAWVQRRVDAKVPA